MELKRKEVIDELASRCEFYKQDTKIFVDALEEMIIEKLSQATFDEDVEIHLAKGLVIGSKRYPEREAHDPRNQNVIKTPEKCIPYVKFTYTFKQKINE